MKPYQARVIEEADELRTKLLALSKFLGSAQFQTLPPKQKQLLKAQSNVMTKYHNILSDRIAAFEGGH